MIRVVLRVERVVVEATPGVDAPSPRVLRAALEEALRAELAAAVDAAAHGGPAARAAALPRVVVDASAAGPGPVGRAVLDAVRGATGGWPASVAASRPDGPPSAGPVAPPPPAAAPAPATAPGRGAGS
ncbi:MAG TPA: hypothetical protein VI248_17040 [Kineosporiaceae bacterium]